jgi:hypothetical protein
MVYGVLLLVLVGGSTALRRRRHRGNGSRELKNQQNEQSHNDQEYPPQLRVSRRSQASRKPSTPSTPESSVPLIQLEHHDNQSSLMVVACSVSQQAGRVPNTIYRSILSCIFGNNVDGGDIENPRTPCWTGSPIYHSIEETHAVSNIDTINNMIL